MLQEEKHFVLDRKDLFVDINEAGFDLVEKVLRERDLIGPNQTLHQSQNLALAHSVNCSLAAITLYRKNIEYMVRDSEIIIVDEHTGRALKGRRWSDGLHQAIEAKEGLEVKADPPQLASITYQSFFALYNHLCGLTGTARSERDEFARQYGLKVAVIPTHSPLIRNDEHDVVYATSHERDCAVVEEVLFARKNKQPVLIGTSSVEASESLADSLKQAGVEPEILNAKNHEREAEIIADAGRPGAVTIATQMAGRGTDILLGGNLDAALARCSDISRYQAIRDRWADDQEAVREAGGLYVIGTTRAPSRRVDRQLRGRAGRQGDPGVSRFFISFEDEFIRTFAGEKLDGIASRFDISQGEALEGKMIDRIIFHAQATRENIDRSVRQQLVKFDSVISNQRAVIYKVRDEWLEALESQEMSDSRDGLIEKSIESAVSAICSRHLPEDPLLTQYVDTAPIVDDIAKKWSLALAPDFFKKFEKEPEKLYGYMLAMAKAYYEHRKSHIRQEVIPVFERVTLLEGLDRAWQEQQRRLDALKDGINLRSFANENPTMAFQKEASTMFESIFDEANEISGRILLGANIPGKKSIDKAA
jgi:preprotein translocase subunit SecA